ncbi:unnamed protein product [Eruca vesicaria subsp. sativa]|uniref:Histone deacetylase interacting domain-containing protein n=1 Tax=Eruca vesicaria subsp. sativa TaxID=29727 RepID=A0ABC8L668_ERUVS|nr:unnamed protein product [Eruca vesicaria subsp. sativa]
MAKKNVLELWSIFKERLSPPDLKTLASLLIDSNRKRIDKNQLIVSALVLFKKDEFLRRCFTDFLTKSQEDKDMSEVEVESLENFCKMVSEDLGPSEFLKLVSSIKDFGKQKIKLSQLRKSVSLLYKTKGQEDDHGKTLEDTGLELEEGEIREDGLLRDPKVKQNYLGIRASVGEKSKEDPKTEIRVSEEPELVKDVDKIKLEGKKRRILQPEQAERTLKKPRMLERVTPSYKLIPEEERCPVSNSVLNNKYTLIKFDDPSGIKKQSKYEEAMARCEDHMFEADVLMETLKSAVENAEKVIAEEMSVEDLGVKFYRCIQRLYCRDMSEIVRENHKRALPVILIRLNQKLDELTVARESWIPMWKRVFEENTAKQREATAQGLRKKVKENSRF